MPRVMVKFLSLLFFLTVFVASLLIFPIKCEVSVKQGNWATYKIQAFEGNATQGEEWVRQRVEEVNKIKWINVTAEEILSDDRVRISEKTFFENSTLNTVTYSSSIRNPSDLRYWIIAGNLRKGDQISEAENITVQETYIDQVANVSRRVNQGFIEVIYTEIEQIQTVEFYWDQETGILCRSLSTYLAVSEGSVNTIVNIMIWIEDTNVWKADSSGNWLLLATILIMLFLAVLTTVLVKHRKAKMRSRRKLRVINYLTYVFSSKVLINPQCFNCKRRRARIRPL